MAAPKKDKTIPAGESRRVITRVPNASDNINGVDFGLLEPEDDHTPPPRVSDALTPDQFARFCAIDGYEPFGGDDALAAQAVEDARKARLTAKPTGSDAQKIADLTKANLAMADDLLRANQRIAELEGGPAADPAALTALKAQLADSEAKVAALEEQAGKRDAYIAQLEEQLTKQ